MNTTALKEFIDAQAELVHTKQIVIGDFWTRLMAHAMFNLAKYETTGDEVTDEVLSDPRIEDAYADFFSDAMREELRKMKAGAN